MSSAPNTFGEWLRDKREAKGLSREELAMAVAVGGGYIGKLEQDVKSPSPKLKVRLEQFFEEKKDEMPHWLSLKLDDVAEAIGSTPQDIINTLVYQFVKDA